MLTSSNHSGRRCAALTCLISATFLAAALSAQKAFAADGAAKQPADPTHSTRLILLGTGSGPISRKLRSQPASLLVVNGKPYLIDVGDGVVRQLAWAGFQPQQLGNIFITHHHLDHNAGLEPLMAFIWIYRSQNAGETTAASSVQIYGPPATGKLVQASLDYLSISERIFNSAGYMPPAQPMFQAHDIGQNGIVYQDDNVRVKAVENTHFHLTPGSPSDAAGDKSYSYRFETPGRSVVFTGDTGPSDAVADLASGADVLVSEVIDEDAMEKFMRETMHMTPQVAKLASDHMLNEHLTPETIGKMAAKAHVGTVVLTHLAPGLDSQTDVTGYVAGVKKYFAGPVIAGRDLFEF